MNALSRPSWSPYVAGACLGVLAAVSVVELGRPLGASGAYDDAAGFLGLAISPNDVFWRFVAPPRFGWQAFLIAGIFLGSLASSLASKSFRFRMMPERGWVEAFGPRWTTRWLVAFLGGVLVEIGASIAGGCTSGLAVSGGIVLSPAAFVFMAGLFAGGIPTSLWARRR